MGTNWAGYSAADLYTIVAHDNVCHGADQLASWERVRSAVEDQRRRLEQVRDQLIEVWPPYRSEASSAFFDVLDGLINHMADNEVKASATATALSGILDAISEGQSKLRDLADTYQIKSHDKMPSLLDSAEDHLDIAAQAVIADVETRVADWGTAIHAPDRYKVPAGTDALKPAGGVGGGTDSGEAGSSGLGTFVGSGVVTPVPHDPLPPSRGGGSGGTVGGGPILQGGSGSLPPGAGGSPGGPVTIPGTPVPPAGGLPAGSVVLPAVAAAAEGLLPSGFGAAGRSGVFGGAGRGFATPPGGVIGQTAAAEAEGLAGRAGRGAGPGVMGGLPGGAGRRDGRAEADSRGEPDNPWGVVEGVPPVIEPPAAPGAHDVGPGVIGMRR